MTWRPDIEYCNFRNLRDDLMYVFFDTGEFQVVLDRRLYQDDNRGLGQGVTDNKVTPANFRLVVERFKSPHEPVSRISCRYFL